MTSPVQLPPPPPRPGHLLVADVSSAQGERPPWQTMLDAGVRAFMVNAGEGEDFPASSATFDQQIREGSEVGMSAGSYYVFRPDHADPTVQSRRFRRIAFDRTALNPACDFEVQASVDGTTCVDRAVTFALEVQQLFGKACEMYVAPGFLAGLRAHPDALAKLAQFPLWLADYRNAPHIPAPFTKLGLWQFDDGRRYRLGAGAPALDLSWWAGTEAELARLGVSSAGGDGLGPVSVGAPRSALATR